VSRGDWLWYRNKSNGSFFKSDGRCDGFPGASRGDAAILDKRSCGLRCCMCLLVFCTTCLCRTELDFAFAFAFDAFAKAINSSPLVSSGLVP